MDFDEDISSPAVNPNAYPNAYPNASTASFAKTAAKKKKRKDDDWADGFRVKRALSSRDSKIRKLEAQNKELKEKTSKADRGRKKAEQEKKVAAKEHYRDKKISREQTLVREVHFKRELKRLQEAHEEELQAAHALAATATEKQLVTEAAKIKAEQKLLSDQEKHTDKMAKASNRQHHRLTREKRGHKAALDHLERQWKKKVDAVIKELRLKHELDNHNTSQKMDAKDREMEDDRGKNADR